jgi:hypothetical protein
MLCPSPCAISRLCFRGRRARPCSRRASVLRRSTAVATRVRSSANSPGFPALASTVPLSPSGTWRCGCAPCAAAPLHADKLVGDLLGGGGQHDLTAAAEPLLLLGVAQCHFGAVWLRNPDATRCITVKLNPVWPSEDRQRDRTEGAKAAREGRGYLEGGQVARARDWHGATHRKRASLKGSIAVLCCRRRHCPQTQFRTWSIKYMKLHLIAQGSGAPR